MTDKIAPALTPEEWTRGGFGDDCSAFISPQEPDNVHCVAAFTEGELRASCADCTTWRQGATFTARRHALAALALAHQPFGFTREDVAMLDGLDLYGDDARDPRYKAIDSLCDRIKALLPPSEP